jgi:hypothetical protein
MSVQKFGGKNLLESRLRIWADHLSTYKEFLGKKKLIVRMEIGLKWLRNGPSDRL